ncbi:glycosyltransferase [Microbacterium azadirachtae]|uniref:glycosyltransferase n=1 Tax=Microbacterium azadirachtae TaxID=582680 RepID=UPI0008883032|nr:glycosyltransferase [Microbacterium azadirachtae]SDM42065.1 Glycosyltransferase involved in cell wall bisynthesis [Microbacterium azadirachtae]SEG57769.1 Glycosyltransferase involved in cell wall bisynthesis [Microbacterium azadirachtae]SEG60752.1 Glycosyltransferase involved in cell wall bisynthesis [Microbacterium azadirachtae]
MTDLVVVSLERWDEVWRRNQHLVSGLLRDDPALRVLFVEPPDDPLYALRRGARPEFGRRPRAISGRLHAIRPVKWLPRRIDPAADERIERAVVRAAARLGMTDPVLWINDPRAAGLARRTGWRTLYDLTDDWLAADRPTAETRRIREGEEWLLAHATAVVACSAELVRRKRPGRADIALVRNGVDVAAYRAPHPRPHDLPSGSVALYLGTLHRDRLDVDLCVRTAAALGGSATLVLVGPNALDDADTARLHEAGAVVLGARPRDAVIGYLQHAEVLLVPHLVTAFTESLDPLKLYEYQAVGRPVVATPVAGFREAAGDRIRLADADEFAAVTLRTLADAAESPDSGPDPVAAADWSQRVAEMRAVLAGAESR